MKKLKMYLDTSIISFVFADDAPEKQCITNEFFKRYLAFYDVHVSGLVLTEIENTADLLLRNKLKNVVKSYNLPLIEIKPKDQKDIFDLAQVYINERIIPQKKFDDAVHVAICVFNEFDILLSD